MGEPKILNIEVDDQIDLSEAMIATGEGPDVKGIRRSDSQGHSAGVDQHGNQLTPTISGPTVENEKGTPETCQILMEKLNGLGGQWNNCECLDEKKKTNDERAVDCRLHSSGGDKPLEIQVTKADCEIWPALAQRPEGVSRTMEIDAVCDSLLIAIKKKAKKYDENVRAGLVLALEAVHFPVSTASIAERFKEKYSQAERSLGFRQVWLVGPTPPLAFQLA